jgi:hypothetical protein
MATNEYNVQRTAKASFVLTSATATSNLTSDAYIPTGAIITGMRVVAPSAVTTTSASHTVVPRVGTLNLCATVNVSDLPAVTVPEITALATTDGIYVTAGGLLNLQQAACTTAVTATYDYYVDYLYNV